MTLTVESLRGRKLLLLLAAVLFAGGNLAFFLAYREGTQTRRAALEARRDALQKSVEAAEAEASRVAGQKERLGGVSSAIEEFYGHRIGTERETLAPVVDEIHAILREAGVAVPQISFATIPVQKMPLVQMRVAFTVHCDYARFKQLLRAFESSKRWIVVHDISISRDSDKPGSVLVQVNLVTYFSDAAGGPEAPATGTGKAAALAARRAG